MRSARSGMGNIIILVLAVLLAYSSGYLTIDTTKTSITIGYTTTGSLSKGTEKIYEVSQDLGD
ncbi:hypothetical protein HN803_02965 [candidate division WWE3 bacterium]|nr:hypothetical protein [candidate division WWE3 bacterium]